MSEDKECPICQGTNEECEFDEVMDYTRDQLLEKYLILSKASTEMIEKVIGFQITVETMQNKCEFEQRLREIPLRMKITDLQDLVKEAYEANKGDHYVDINDEVLSNYEDFKDSDIKKKLDKLKEDICEQQT